MRRSRSTRSRPLTRAALLLASLASGGCPIQRPPVPPEFLEVRYAVADSTAVVAEALLVADTAGQALLRERLPALAAQKHADTLVARISDEPTLEPLGIKIRGILDRAYAEASGRSRGAWEHRDAQRQLVEAVVLGLARALRRSEGAEAPEPR